IATQLAPGTMVGPFRIVRLLGRGGMAAVYEAQDASLDRAVALKLLPPQFLYDEAFARRFEGEARVVARLEHPNIVPNYARGIVAYERLVGEAPFTGDSPVVVMFKHVNDALPDVPAAVVPSAVMRVIRTAAAKRPSSRFASASEFVDALAAAIEGASGPRRRQ